MYSRVVSLSLWAPFTCLQCIKAEMFLNILWYCIQSVLLKYRIFHYLPLSTVWKVCIPPTSWPICSYMGHPCSSQYQHEAKQQLRHYRQAAASPSWLISWRLSTTDRQEPFISWLKYNSLKSGLHLAQSQPSAQVYDHSIWTAALYMLTKCSRIQGHPVTSSTPPHIAPHNNLTSSPKMWLWHSQSGWPISIKHARWIPLQLTLACPSGH